MRKATAKAKGEVACRAVQALGEVKECPEPMSKQEWVERLFHNISCHSWPLTPASSANTTRLGFSSLG